MPLQAIASARRAGVQHLILATCCYDDVVSQLTLLANAVAGDGHGPLPLRLCGVVACLTSDLLMQDPARCAIQHAGGEGGGGGGQRAPQPRSACAGAVSHMLHA